ncbi:MAG: hypothetical protein KDB22_17625 [Planctomycetales bacterium]|nr:hypothetical protein [Planctomycetales bacterium]
MPDGDQVGFLVNGGSLKQQLNADLLPNMHYTLTVQVGDRLGIPFADYSVGLYANGNFLAQALSADFRPADGQFITATVHYASPSVVAPGQRLEIRLKELEGAMHVLGKSDWI